MNRPTIIRVAIAGIGGRMGSMVGRLVNQAPDMELVAASEIEGHALIGHAPHCGAPIVVTPTSALELHAVDVVVEFTRPDVSAEVISMAQQCGTAVVSGTTGLSSSDFQGLREAARFVPVLWSPNMSVGIHAFYRAVALLSHQLGNEYEVAVQDIHHRHKVDAPSGTAKQLLELLPDGTPCASFRLGDVVGEHVVHFAGQGERITISHMATSRECFAYGALRAMRFICGRAPRMYTMADCLAHHE